MTQFNARSHSVSPLRSLVNFAVDQPMVVKSLTFGNSSKISHSASDERSYDLWMFYGDQNIPLNFDVVFVRVESEKNLLSAVLMDSISSSSSS